MPVSAPNKGADTDLNEWIFFLRDNSNDDDSGLQMQQQTIWIWSNIMKYLN